MHKCICLFVCIVFFCCYTTQVHTNKTTICYDSCAHRMKKTGRQCRSSTKSLLTLPHLVHTSFHVVLLCVACLHQLCCFHVVLLVFMLCCCVLFCTIKAYKVQLPHGSVSKKYKTCFTCTCCYPGIDLVKTGKVYKHFKQQ